MDKQIKKNKNSLLTLSKKALREVYYLAMHVELKSLPKVFAARWKKRPLEVQLKNEPVPYEINQYMAFIHRHCKRKLKDLYLWEVDQKQIGGNYTQFLNLLGEYFTDIIDDAYPYDWNNKRVIDIGGFVGDTALYFLSKGARQLFIYEPLSMNMKALEYNMEPYQDRVKCYQEALSNTNGPVTLSSSDPEGFYGFGMTVGKHQVSVQGVTISELLSRHHSIDVVKVDCEGGEEHLLTMSIDDMHSVPYWMIETHTQTLYQQMVKKFCENGFTKTYDKQMAPGINMLHFVRPA